MLLREPSIALQSPLEHGWKLKPFPGGLSHLQEPLLGWSSSLSKNGIANKIFFSISFIIICIFIQTAEGVRREVSEHKLLAVPTRLGGLNINDPGEMSMSEI